MKLVITGTPGVGKTVVAKELGETLGIKVINEKEFALKQGIGEFDSETNEIEIDLLKLQKSFQKFLKDQKDIILEGHLLSEIKLDIDLVVLLRVNPEILQERLELRGYLPEKTLDDVFCEGIDYCKKHAERNYGKNKIIEIFSQKTIKDTLNNIIKTVEEKGLMKEKKKNKK